MLRFLLIAIVFAASVHSGFAAGMVDDLYEAEAIAVLQSGKVGTDLADLPDDVGCCQTDSFLKSSASVCKPDCKAVISLTIIITPKAPADFSAGATRLRDILFSYMDLRPPIS
ncbi:MAG: hypothetical protein AAF468_11425 [Pseudomonadota bacterium]